MSSGRKEIFELLYRRAGEFYTESRPSRFEVKEALETILELLEEALLKGERVTISGFGTFYLQEERERKGRDFITGDFKEIPPRKKIKFRPSSKLLKLFNS